MGWPTTLLGFLSQGIYKLSPVPLADGATGPIAIDSIGRLRTVVEGGTGGSDPTATFLSPGSAGLKASGQLSPAPAKLAALYGYNNDTNPYYLQVFDATSAPPVDTPSKWEMLVPPKQNFFFEPRDSIQFSVGIFWALSTQPALYVSTSTAATYLNAIITQ